MQKTTAAKRKMERSTMLGRMIMIYSTMLRKTEMIIRMMGMTTTMMTMT